MAVVFTIFDPDLKNVIRFHGPTKTYAFVGADRKNESSTKVDEEGDIFAYRGEALIIPLREPIDKDTTLFIYIVHAGNEKDTKEPIGFTRLRLKEVLDDAGFDECVVRTLQLKHPSGRPRGTVNVMVLIKEPGRAPPGHGISHFEYPSAAYQPGHGGYRPAAYQPGHGGYRPAAYQPGHGGYPLASYQPGHGGYRPAGYQPGHGGYRPAGYQPAHDGYLLAYGANPPPVYGAYPPPAYPNAQDSKSKLEELINGLSFGLRFESVVELFQNMADSAGANSA